MLRLQGLTDAEYTISAVAEGLEEYYLGHGETPGVWAGSWAEELGLSGVVGHDDLRALVEGHDPEVGTDLLAGRPERRDMAFDATFSPPSRSPCCGPSELHKPAHGARYESPVERMKADERASLATRRPKDRSLTPELLRQRWDRGRRRGPGHRPGAGGRSAASPRDPPGAELGSRHRRPAG